MAKYWSQTCDRCGQNYLSRQCRLICENCGAQLDCSDLFIDWNMVQATQTAIEARSKKTTTSKKD